MKCEASPTGRVQNATAETRHAAATRLQQRKEVVARDDTAATRFEMPSRLLGSETRRAMATRLQQRGEVATRYERLEAAVL